MTDHSPVTIPPLVASRGKRVLIAIAAAALLTSRLSSEPVQRRGAFAFHYGSPLTTAELDWYSRFDLLVTHDPLPPEQVAALHRRGTRLVLYEWSVAFYDSLAPDGSWERSLLLSGNSPVLLNHQPLRGGVGAAGADAWYFDPTAPEHMVVRAEQIAQRLRAVGYDGVFFDTTRFESVHPIARAEFRRRHRGASYDAAFSRFLKQLRRQLPAGIIFTNQGFQAAEHYLPFADWDLTESFVTHPKGDRFVRRPWNRESDPWNSTRFIMERLIEPAAKRFPKVRFGHLNYAAGRNLEAIRLVLTAALLFEDAGYVVGPAVSDEFDEGYFLDPGKPKGPLRDLPGGRGSYRLYDRALVAVVDGKEPVVLDDPLLRGVSFRDAFRGTPIPSRGPLILDGSPSGAALGYFLWRSDSRVAK